MSTSAIYDFIGNSTYAMLAAVALWGAYSAIMVFRRISQTRFRNEAAQEEFLGEIEQQLGGGDFDAVVDLCEGDRRAMPQLVLLAVTNRQLGYAKLRSLVADRFRRDILSDIEYRISWVSTVIKTAPMLGLFGTVLGMMAAFGKLASGSQVKPEDLAGDISLALITTALGLMIAIPLIMVVASINMRLKQMEDLVGQGLQSFFDIFKLTFPGGGRGT